MSTPRTHAVVVGGGLAGTSAALALADRGWEVTLLESRARLGGAVYSFRRDGLEVDTGQHVLLRCYTEYRALLGRLGMADRAPFQPRMDIPVLDAAGRLHRLRRSRILPAPLHLAGALLGYSPLSPAGRLRAARAMSALGRVPFQDPGVDEETFGSWLRRHGQTHDEINALWGLITVAALNMEVDEASAALAAQVFRTALLEDAKASDIGILDVPLSAVHDRAARSALTRAGVRCVVRDRVHAVDPLGDSRPDRLDADRAERDGGFVVRTASGEVPADAVVVAVPHRHATTLVPAAACPDRERWSLLGSSPIVNVHVHYDRRVTRHEFAAVLGSPVPWFFDRTAAATGERDSADPAGRSREAGQYLVVSVSAADAAMDMPADRLLDQHRAALGRVLPASRDAEVLDAFVTREPHATFRQQAGSARLRPPAVTALPGLLLAGAWTATGWPDTLEGAVRSGVGAADRLGSPDRIRRSVIAR